MVKVFCIQGYDPTDIIASGNPATGAKGHDFLQGVRLDAGPDFFVFGLRERWAASGPVVDVDDSVIVFEVGVDLGLCRHSVPPVSREGKFIAIISGWLYPVPAWQHCDYKSLKISAGSLHLLYLKSAISFSDLSRVNALGELTVFSYFQMSVLERPNLAPNCSYVSPVRSRAAFTMSAKGLNSGCLVVLLMIIY